MTYSAATAWKRALKKPSLSLRDLSGHTAHPGPHSTVMGEGKERKNIDVGPAFIGVQGGVRGVSPVQFLL